MKITSLRGRSQRRMRKKTSESVKGGPVQAIACERLGASRHPPKTETNGGSRAGLGCAVECMSWGSLCRSEESKEQRASAVTFLPPGVLCAQSSIPLSIVCHDKVGL